MDSIKDSSINTNIDIIDIYKNDIELYISMFCEENNIKESEIITISQNRFNALLYYLYNKVFKNVNLKKNDSYNSYNIDLINDICETYIYICDLYDKIANLQGFCRMIGVRTETVYEWGREDGRKVTSQRSDIAKRLQQERERSLSDRLSTGKTNPVGVLGCLNHWHNWQGVGKMEARKETVLSLDQVRNSAGLLSDNSTQIVADQDENGRLKLSEN